MMNERGEPIKTRRNPAIIVEKWRPAGGLSEKGSDSNDGKRGTKTGRPDYSKLDFSFDRSSCGCGCGPGRNSGI